MSTKRLTFVAVLTLILSSCSAAGPQEAEIEMQVNRVLANPPQSLEPSTLTTEDWSGRARTLR